VLLLKGVGELEDAGDQPPLAGGEDAVVGVGEAGEIELRKLLQGVLGVQESRLQFVRRGPERGDRGCAGCRRGAARIAQQCLPGRGVGRRAPGREHGLGLTGAQPVAHDTLSQAGLLRGGQAGQGVRGGGREPPGIEVARALGGQAVAERRAPVHPPAPATEQLGDLRGRQVIVGDEGVHDAGLVHRADGALGRVGLEEPSLAHDAGERVAFHDHGDVGVALATPAGQSLEPIEHLVGAVADRRHADRQRGQRGADVGAGATQRRERGGQPIDRDLEHRTHGRSAARRRAWGERRAAAPGSEGIPPARIALGDGVGPRAHARGIHRLGELEREPHRCSSSAKT
jgi:hypothetical protein